MTTDTEAEAVAWRWRKRGTVNPWEMRGNPIEGPGVTDFYEIEPLFPISSLASRDARIAELEGEVNDLKQSVIAFCGPWAGIYARDFGLPDGHLHPTHYDILERCGARMVDFTRGEP